VVQRALLLEEKETLLPSKSPGSAASSYGPARLVASYSILECKWGWWGGGGVTGENRRFWVEFCVKGRHFDEILFHVGRLN